MAKTERTCPQCSKSEIRFEGRNRKEVERYADWRMENGTVCKECFLEQKKAEGDRAAEENKEAGLPELEGTLKQVPWAERIRQQYAGTIQSVIDCVINLSRNDEIGVEQHNDLPIGWQLNTLNLVSDLIDTESRRIEAIVECCRLALDETDAGWWIDNRNMTLQTVIDSFWQSVAARFVDSERYEQDAVAGEAEIKPAQAGDDRAKVGIQGNMVVLESWSVAAVEPVARQFEMSKRTPYSWAMSVNETLGAAVDRAAEVANRLLHDGVVVSVQNTDARQRAIEGSFEPVYPRWIGGQVEKPFKGWLWVVIRDEGHADLQYELDRMGGRRDWHRAGGFYVPPSRYADLEDMAEMHGFRITTEGRRILDRARHRDEARLLLEEVPEAPRAELDAGPDSSDEPDGINPELRDD